ncbi:MAG: DUF3185 domain-containing protein [Proteobacteria bacterium]|nr:DUF3185 domain-containing protein [Pseudomonadota bacterium]
MKIFINIVGVLLLVGGIVVLSYQGFTYTEKEEVVKFGELQITAEKKKRVSFPPLLGGLCVAGGIVLLIIGRMNRK